MADTQKALGAVVNELVVRYSMHHKLKLVPAVAAIAKATGVSVPSVYNWRNGTFVSDRAVQKLCAFAASARVPHIDEGWKVRLLQAVANHRQSEVAPTTQQSLPSLPNFTLADLIADLRMCLDSHYHDGSIAVASYAGISDGVITGEKPPSVMDMVRLIELSIKEMNEVWVEQLLLAWKNN